jgi:hypothetical protein
LIEQESIANIANYECETTLHERMTFKTLVTGSILIILSHTVRPAMAQPDSTAMDLFPESESGIDSSYIGDYTELFTTRLYLLFQNASLLVNVPDESISKIVYRPNVNVRVGIAGFWKWFGLGLSINNPFYKPDQNEFGKTRTTDLRVNAFGRQLAGELFLQQYRGFYISSPLRPDGSHYIIPDMKTFFFFFSGYYIYNDKKFSIRAAFTQNERQKRSAGSLVVRPAFLYFEISSDQGIIPPEIIESYGIPATYLVTRGKFYSVGLSPGYAYTFVFLKHFYLTAAVFPGVAAQFANYSNDTDVYTKFEFSFQLGGRFALGYNSDKWFLGGSVQTGFHEVPNTLNNALFNYDVAQFRFWGGTRFDIFKKKKKSPAKY